MNIGTLMLKAIYEGYIPCLILAAVGYSMLGGGLLAWSAFVWIFGAVLTVAMAFVRARAAEAEHRPQTVAAFENC